MEKVRMKMKSKQSMRKIIKIMLCWMRRVISRNKKNRKRKKRKKGEKKRKKVMMKLIMK